MKYGTDADYGALALSSDFTAKVPDLDIARASVSATTQGTFVTIAGQNINELTAKTDYVNKQLDVRRDGEAAAADDGRRGFAGPAPGSPGGAPAAPRPRDTGNDLADGRRNRGDDRVREPTR